MKIPENLIGEIIFKNTFFGLFSTIDSTFLPTLEKKWDPNDQSLWKFFTTVVSQSICREH